MFGRLFRKKPGGLTKLQFTDRFVERFRLYFPEAEFLVARELEYQWRPPGQGVITQELDVFWPLFQKTPPELQPDVIDRLADFMIKEYYPDRIGRTFESPIRFGLQHVLPVIRPKDNAMTAVGLLRGMPHREFADDLIMHYVIDQTDSMTSLWNPQLEELGVDEATLWRCALDNLRRRSLTVEYTQNNVGFVMQGDDYESSLILDDEFWSEIESRYGGEHIAIIPCSNTLLFARPDSEEVGELLKHSAEIFLEHKIAISRTPMVRRNGVWQLWPVPDHLKPKIAIN